MEQSTIRMKRIIPVVFYAEREKPGMPANVSYSNNPLKGMFYLIAGVFIFSIQDVIIKYMSGDYPVHEIVLIRSIFAIIPILILAHFMGGIRSMRTRRYGAHTLRAFVQFATYMCFYMSLAALSLAETVTLFFSSPLFITILSVVILNEKVTLDHWIAVLAGFLGVIVIFNPGTDSFNPAFLLAVLSAFLYAVASILTRRIGQTESGISLAFYPTVFYIVFSSIVGMAVSNSTFSKGVHPSLDFLLCEWAFPAQFDLLLLISIGLIAAFGFFFLSQAYRLAQPSMVAPFEYTAVLFSLLWGYIIWNDILGVRLIMGIFLIVGSGLYIFLRKPVIESTFGSKYFRKRISPAGETKKR